MVVSCIIGVTLTVLLVTSFAMTVWVQKLQTLGEAWQTFYPGFIAIAALDANAIHEAPIFIWVAVGGLCFFWPRLLKSISLQMRRRRERQDH